MKYFFISLQIQQVQKHVNLLIWLIIKYFVCSQTKFNLSLKIAARNLRPLLNLFRFKVFALSKIFIRPENWRKFIIIWQSFIHSVIEIFVDVVFIYWEKFLHFDIKTFYNINIFPWFWWPLHKDNLATVLSNLLALVQNTPLEFRKNLWVEGTWICHIESNPRVGCGR